MIKKLFHLVTDHFRSEANQRCTLMRFWLIVSLCLFPGVLFAEVFKYIDDNQITHYVTEREDVPEKYRDQVNTPHKLPKIAKSEYRGYEGVELSSPSSERVEIFVTSWCHFCEKAEEFMKKNGVRFKSYDIEKSQIGKKKHKEAGGGGVPVIKVGDEIVRGFNEPKLRKLLDL